MEEKPEISLYKWGIFRTASGALHFAGERANGHGRASSTIVELDLKARTGTTRSGRKYRLCGPCGLSDEAGYVWDGWCRLNNIIRYKDVTNELLKAIVE